MSGTSGVFWFYAVDALDKLITLVLESLKFGGANFCEPDACSAFYGDVRVAPGV